MTVVGVAEVLVSPITNGFESDLKQQTSTALDGLATDAEIAGRNTGTALRDGVNSEAAKLENDLTTIGSVGGVNLREGVGGEAGKLGDDLANVGEEAGGKFSESMSKGLGGLANVIGATGLPLEGLAGGLEKTAGAAEEGGASIEGMLGPLAGMAGPITIGGTALLALAGGATKLGLDFQTAEAKIATSAGTTVQAADQIGTAMLGTMGKSEFSATEMATAFAQVAGQLKSVEGHALDAAQAMQVMTAADDLATAKQIDLGTATQAIVSVMQAFQLKTQDAAHVSDVLFAASAATGQSVDALAQSLDKVRAKLGDTTGSVGDLAGLLVDLTDRGITGRAAMSALNGAMNTLEKTATGIQTALQTQKAAYDELTPSLRTLADQYLSGALTSTQLTKATSALVPAQANALKAFVTANTAVDTAKQKYQELGITVFNAQGDFVGMGSIIDQLSPKFQTMTSQQQLATAATIFGASAARQMVQVIDAGPQAYDKATASVNRMGSAHQAASVQSQTLSVELKTLEASANDLGTRLGVVLVPIITKAVGVLDDMFTAGVSVTHWVENNQFGQIALDITESIIDPAILVITHFNDIISAGESVVSSIGGFFSKLPGEILSAVEALPADFLHLGEEMVTSIVNGIESAPGAIVHAIEGLIPGGGLIASAAHIIGLASGGIVTSPTLAVVGEAGPEAVIPLSGGIRADGGAITPLPAATAAKSTGGGAQISQQFVFNAANMSPSQLFSEAAMAAKIGAVPTTPAMAGV